MQSKHKKGFSLVELLITMAVIGILFTTFVSRSGFALNKARESGVANAFTTYELALSVTARSNNGFAGDSIKMFRQINNNLDKEHQINPTISGSIIEDQDPWKHPYKIWYSGKSGSSDTSRVVIQSAGSDARYSELVTISSLGLGSAGSLSRTKNNLINMGSNPDFKDYLLVVDYIDGKVDTYTVGFTQSNLE